MPYGEYRTKRLVLEAYDRYAGQIQPYRHSEGAVIAR